jgi:hypothetical protein
MSIIIQEEEKLKEVITIEMAQGRLHRLNNFGWSIAKYFYTFQKVPEKETWENLMECFWELPQNAQALFIEKLQGNNKT